MSVNYTVISVISMFIICTSLLLVRSLLVSCINNKAKCCNFDNFRENSISTNSFKRHICDTQRSRLRREFAIWRGFYFCVTSHMQSFAKIKPSIISEFTVGGEGGRGNLLMDINR